MNRLFSTGSQWLYYKIYTGYKIADVLLLDYLNEKIEKILADHTINKWFFIRYNDSDSHLRIRFEVDHVNQVYQVIAELHPIFEDLLQKNLIWKVQNDTYVREIERYGLNTMTDSETLFYFDSVMIIKYLSLKHKFDKEVSQIVFSCLSIDSFLNSFSLSISEKFRLLDEMQQSFKKECNATKVLKTELDKHYRTIEKDISSVLAFQAYHYFTPFYEIIEAKNNQMKSVVQAITTNLEINLNSFLSSHIHMMINRQYSSRQREYETIIYDHLYRYYKTTLYTNKKVSSVLFS